MILFKVQVNIAKGFHWIICKEKETNRYLVLKLFHKIFVNITKYCEVSAKYIKEKRVSSLAYLLIFSAIGNLQEGCTEF